MRSEKYYILLLTLILFFVCCDEPENTIIPQIKIISGQNQHAQAGQMLGNSIVVQILDSNQNPLTNIEVKFQILLGGGQLNNIGRIYTDEEGFAEIRWTIGNGNEHILKIYLPEYVSSIKPSYVYANSPLVLETQWISGLKYYYYSTEMPHDNIILQSNNVLVFSLYSSYDAKIILNKIAEESLHEILISLGIGDVESIGIYPADNNTKLHIFSRTTEPGATASPNGCIVPSYYSQYYNRGRYKQLVKHELTHVVQFRIGIEYSWTPTWFIDGFAEYISGGVYTPIDKLSELDEWLEDPDHINPLLIRTLDDYPVPLSRQHEYYPMFGLSIHYLMDENGLGKRVNDIMKMFNDMINLNMTFTNAFEKHMGISIQFYEDNYWELIRNYLTKKTSMIENE